MAAKYIGTKKKTTTSSSSSKKSTSSTTVSDPLDSFSSGNWNLNESGSSNNNSSSSSNSNSNNNTASNEWLNTGGGTAVVNNGTPATSNMQVEMAANSAAWANADAATKLKLEQRNQELGAQLGLVYNSAAGTWGTSAANNVDVPTTTNVPIVPATVPNTTAINTTIPTVTTPVLKTVAPLQTPTVTNSALQNQATTNYLGATNLNVQKPTFGSPGTATNTTSTTIASPYNGAVDFSSVSPDILSKLNYNAAGYLLDDSGKPITDASTVSMFLNYFKENGIPNTASSGSDIAPNTGTLEKMPTVISGPNASTTPPNVTSMLNTPTVAQPQFGGSNFLSDYINYDYNKINDIFRNNVEANYAAQEKEYQQNENKYYNNIYNLQNSALDTLRKNRNSAVATGASSGLQSANELLTMMGLNQDSVAGTTQLAQNRNLLSDKKSAALADATQSALTTANAAGSSAANVAANIYAADTQYSVGQLAAIAQMQAAAEQASATKYNSDRQYDATKYSSDSASNTSKYTSDNNLAGTQYATDGNITAAQIAANANLAAAQYAANNNLKAAQITANSNLTGTKYNADQNLTAAQAAAAANLAATNQYKSGTASGTGSSGSAASSADARTPANLINNGNYTDWRYFYAKDMGEAAAQKQWILSGGDPTQVGYRPANAAEETAYANQGIVVTTAGGYAYVPGNTLALNATSTTGDVPWWQTVAGSISNNPYYTP